MTKRTTIIGVSVVVVLIALVGGVWLYGQQARPVAPQSPPSFHARPSSSQAQSSTTRPAVTPEASTATNTPTLALPSATPALIIVNTSTLVTVTVQILDPTLVPGSVNLLRLGATGTQPTILGVMHDDGLNGDAVAGDHIYSLRVPFNEPAPGQIQLQVSAAFRGLLRRVLSSYIGINVWSLVTDASSGLTFALPPLGSSASVIDRGPTSNTLFAIQVGAIDPSDNLFHSLFQIFALPNPSHDDLRTWFEENVDDSNGTLLASNAFQNQQLPNGAAFVNVGPIPATYQGGPVAQAYALSVSGDRIYAVIQSQDGQLTDFGYSASSVPGLLTAVLGSIE